MNLMDMLTAATTSGPSVDDKIAINDLHRIVNNLPVEDAFDVGTIIAWEQSGYLYAAIKTPVGWTTTAGEGNKAQPQIPRTTDLVGLSTLLALDKVTRVGVFTHAVMVKG